MGVSKNIKEAVSSADHAMLSLLSALESDRQVTQRSLAARIGVALGLTNSLLKRAVHKGLVKVMEAPTKRYAYYLTPKGFNEKGRLVAEYLSSSLSFFRQARGEYENLYDQLLRDGHKRVVLFGAGELAEIAVMSASQCEVELQGIIDPGSNQPRSVGLRVYVDVATAMVDGADAVVITASTNPQEIFDDLSELIDAKKAYVVPLLHVNTNGSEAGE